MKKKRLKRCIRDRDEEEFWGFRLCASFCWEEIEEIEMKNDFTLLGFVYVFCWEEMEEMAKTLRWRGECRDGKQIEMNRKLKRWWRDKNRRRTRRREVKLFLWAWKEAYSSVTRETLPLLGSCRPQYTPSQAPPQGSLPTQLPSVALGSKRAARNAFRTAAALQSINQSTATKNTLCRGILVCIFISHQFLLCADSQSTSPFDSLPKANNSSIPRGERGKLYGALTGNMVHLLSPGSESDATKFTKKHNKAKKRAVCCHRLFCHSEAFQFPTPESTTTTAAARPPQTDAESRPAIHSLCRLFWHLQSRNYPPEPPAQNLYKPTA